MHGVPVNLTTQKSADPDELSVCPYDSTHVVSAMRYVRHVHKCSKNHPHIQLETCRFNARHRFKPPEMRHHESICPDRHTLERQQQSQGESASPAEPPTANAQVYFFDDDEESWDDDIVDRRNCRVLDSFNSALMSGTRNLNEKVRVERIKSELKELKQMASQAHALPSRRPITASGTIVGGAVGAVTNHFMGGTGDGSKSKMHPRLAPNFASRTDVSENRGRGWNFHDSNNYVAGRGRVLTGSLLSDRSGYNSSSVGNPRDLDTIEKGCGGKEDADV